MAKIYEQILHLVQSFQNQPYNPRFGTELPPPHYGEMAFQNKVD